MKINILSTSGFFIYGNYGSALQAHALQKALELLGHEPKLILGMDFSGKKLPTWAQTCFEPMRLFAPIFRHLIDVGRLRFSPMTYRKRHERFTSFIKKYIRITSFGYTKHERIHHLPTADAYICGSDQIWGMNPIDMSFFFPRIDRRKCMSYAASGPWPVLERHDNWVQEVGPYLRDFRAVGVREINGVELCKKAGANNVTLTIDPTLLLPAEHYEQMISASRIIEEPYLLFYMLNETSIDNLPLEAAKSYSKEHGLRLIILSGQGTDSVLPSEFFESTGPLEFLNLIKNATAVITNSFHGSIFCILFQTPYLVCLQKGVTAAENIRFYSALTKLGQNDRLGELDTLNMNLLNKVPTDAIPLLTAWRQESYEFLRKNLEAIAAKQNA